MDTKWIQAWLAWFGHSWLVQNDFVCILDPLPNATQRRPDLTKLKTAKKLGFEYCGGTAFSKRIGVFCQIDTTVSKYLLDGQSSGDF